MRQRTITSQENIESCLGSGTKQDAIPEPVPPLKAHGGNIVVGKFGRE